jgi:hypothetical protein
MIGEPVAAEHTFTNYVRAASSSLFHEQLGLLNQFEGKIPEYPGRVHDYYRINRVISDVPEISTKSWSDSLSNILRTLGPTRQMNVVLLITSIDNPQYLEAIKGAWQGAKKNDAVIVIGTTYPEIKWVGVHSWSKNAMFDVAMRDALLDMKTVDEKEVMTTIRKIGLSHFERRPMAEFEYLKDSIDPPTWVIVLSLVLGVVASVGLSIYFSRPGVDVDISR